MCKKIGKDRACGSRDNLADRQTHTQTYSSQYFATAPAGEVIIVSQRASTRYRYKWKQWYVKTRNSDTSNLLCQQSVLIVHHVKAHSGREPSEVSGTDFYGPDAQWRKDGLKSKGTKQNFWLGVLIKWGSVLPLQKVGVRTPVPPNITLMWMLFLLPNQRTSKYWPHPWKSALLRPPHFCLYTGSRTPTHNYSSLHSLWICRHMKAVPFIVRRNPPTGGNCADGPGNSRHGITTSSFSFIFPLRQCTSSHSSRG